MSYEERGELKERQTETVPPPPPVEEEEEEAETGEPEIQEFPEAAEPQPVSLFAIIIAISFSQSLIR